MKRRTTLIGAISTAIGSLGSILAAMGLCACTLAPLLSFFGLLSIIIGFLTRYYLIFLTIGIALLITSFILYDKKKVCKIHNK